jgi:hypothetical protein
VPGGGACIRTNSSYDSFCQSFGTPVRNTQTCPPPNPCTATYSQNCTSCLVDAQNKQCGYCAALGSGACFGAASGSFIPLLCGSALNGTFLTTTGNLTNCPTSLSFTFAPTPLPTSATPTTSGATTTSTATTPSGATTTTTTTTNASGSGATTAEPVSGGSDTTASGTADTTTRAPLPCKEETIALICKNQCEGKTMFGKCECVNGISNVVCDGEGTCSEGTAQEICLSKCGTKINIKTCECNANVPNIKCHDEETIAVTSSANERVLFASLVVTMCAHIFNL